MLNDFVEEYEPDDFEITNTSEGIHVSLIFDRNRLTGIPTSQSSIDWVEMDNGDSSDEECYNCRRDVSGYPVPPIRIVRESGEFEGLDVEEHYLCIKCSPGHYDDVARTIDYFAVEDSEVVKTGVETEEGIEWERWEEDNPFTLDTVNVIEELIL